MIEGLRYAARQYSVQFSRCKMDEALASFVEQGPRPHARLLGLGPSAQPCESRGP